MVKVVGIQFYKNEKPSGKVYFFGAKDLNIKAGFDLVVETDRGEEIVRAATDVEEKSKDKIAFEIKDVVRIATKKDLKNKQRNIEESYEIYAEVKEFVEQNLPEMQVISVDYTLNRDQLLIFFVSEGRVDFRVLVKQLASRYRTRIELRQVGVRDEAKVIGGIGMCGRIICCNSFASEFEAVSINMAKNQSLSLIPSKIGGLCGRLLCCLRYEDEEYTRLKKGMPKLGKKYKTEQGEGKVVSHNVLLRTFKVFVKDVGIVDIKLDGSN